MTCGTYQENTFCDNIILNEKYLQINVANWSVHEIYRYSTANILDKDQSHIDKSSIDGHVFDNFCI